MKKLNAIAAAGLAAAGIAAAAAPAFAHHSFSIFDNERTQVFTGVVTRVNPDANHLQIFFAVMNDERKNVIRDEGGDPVVWAVEMAGSAAASREGVSVNAFPAGTVFSVGLHPLRNGDPAGHREGGLFKCPVGENGRSVPPPAGMHCDSVEGHTVVGAGSLPEPTE